MLVPLRHLHTFLNTLPLDELPEDVSLAYDVAKGFHFVIQNDSERTSYWNRRLHLFLSQLNRISDHEEYLTVKEIATHLKVSTDFVYSMIKGQDDDHPVLPSIKTSAGYRIHRRDYLSYLNSQFQDFSDNGS